MGTTNSRPRGVFDLQSQQRAARADREQIRRLVQSIPEPPPAATGGPQGMTRIDAGGTYITASVMWLNGWVADTTWDPADPSSPPAVGPATGPFGGETFAVVESGWYAIRYYLGTDVGQGSLTDLTVIAGNDPASSFDSHMLIESVTMGGNGLFWTGTIPAVWLTAGQQQLALRLTYTGSGTPFANFAEADIDLTRIG